MAKYCFLAGGCCFLPFYRHNYRQLSCILPIIFQAYQSFKRHFPCWSPGCTATQNIGGGTVYCFGGTYYRYYSSIPPDTICQKPACGIRSQRIDLCYYVL